MAPVRISGGAPTASLSHAARLVPDIAEAMALYRVQAEWTRRNWLCTPLQAVLQGPSHGQTDVAVAASCRSPACRQASNCCSPSSVPGKGELTMPHTHFAVTAC